KTLAKKFPNDARVERALAHTYMAVGNGVEALRWLAKVLAQNEAIAYDGEIVQAASIALTASAPLSADAAIALLENDFGSRGIDVLYALVLKPPKPEKGH